jgi:NAD(P)-dependent dehydrogenase (short-subunit alcohol dehydrogenase family)
MFEAVGRSNGTATKAGQSDYADEDKFMQINRTTGLVTGANRGIGRALVAALLEAGVVKVYAAARRSESLTPLRDPRVIPLTVDVTDRAAVDALPAKAPDVNLLVNNAGILDFGDILNSPLKVVTREFETNFYGQLVMARAFAPVIERNGGGAIANMLTVVALASMPGLAAYNASKAAAWSMTQSLRASLAGRGVAVHSVFPGPVDTDMAASIPIEKTSAADVAAAIVAGIQAGDEDIFPDPMSAKTYAAWRSDHKAVEKQFAAM